MILLLIVHIIIASTGLVTSTAAAVSPSLSKIYGTYALIVATIATGSALVAETHSPILHSCISGLVYGGLAASGALVARRKLAYQREISKKQ